MVQVRLFRVAVILRKRVVLVPAPLVLSGLGPQRQRGGSRC